LYNSITILPIGSPLMVMSKNTRGLSGWRITASLLTGCEGSDSPLANRGATGEAAEADTDDEAAATEAAEAAADAAGAAEAAVALLLLSIGGAAAVAGAADDMVG
jgi:hypothetical protein